MKFEAMIQRNGSKIFGKSGDVGLEEILMELDQAVKKEIDARK